MKKDCYEFCWIVDFPMYEIGEESGGQLNTVTYKVILVCQDI